MSVCASSLESVDGGRRDNPLFPILRVRTVPEDVEIYSRAARVFSTNLGKMVDQIRFPDPEGPSTTMIMIG